MTKDVLILRVFRREKKEMQIHTKVDRGGK